MLSFYWSMKTFILEKKKLCDFFIHFVSLRSNGNNLASICPFNTGPPVNENSIFYLFWWFGLSPSSFLISPHWLNVLRRCKCPQLAKKVADIPELVLNSKIYHVNKTSIWTCLWKYLVLRGSNVKWLNLSSKSANMPPENRKCQSFSSFVFV